MKYALIITFIMLTGTLTGKEWKKIEHDKYVSYYIPEYYTPMDSDKVYSPNAKIEYNDLIVRAFRHPGVDTIVMRNSNDLQDFYRIIERKNINEIDGKLIYDSIVKIHNIEMRYYSINSYSDNDSVVYDNLLFHLKGWTYLFHFRQLSSLRNELTTERDSILSSIEFAQGITRKDQLTRVLASSRTFNKRDDSAGMLATIGLLGLGIWLITLIVKKRNDRR